MNMESIKTYILVVGLLLCIDVCDGRIRCYVCSTQSGTLKSRCGDDFKLSPIDAPYCSGTCTKTRGYRDDGDRRVAEVTRGCVESHKTECTKGSHNGISGADLCYCNEDLCNMAPGVATSSWIMLVTSSACVLYLTRWT